MEETDENEAAKKFCSIFRSILDNHAPIKVFQTRKNYAPWVSTETKSLIEERDKLKEESTQSDDPEVLKRYKILRNKIKSRLENHEKKEYYKNKFSEANTYSGKAWKTAYQFLGKTQDLSPKHINSNGKRISAPKLLAEAFNSIFLNKVKNLVSSLSGQVLFHPCERLASWLQGRDAPIEEFQLEEISLPTLRKFIKKLKGNRSSGIDQIDSFSLKLAAPHIELVLLHLVNLPIKNGAYPQVWKTQLIYPFYKKGDRTVGENYRPVLALIVN